MTRTTLLLAASLLLVSVLPVASAGVKPCVGDFCPAPENARCFSKVYWLNIDFGAGAGSCTDLDASCQTTWAGTGGLGGFWSLYARACADLDAMCVTPTLTVHEDAAWTRVVCLA